MNIVIKKQSDNLIFELYGELDEYNADYTRKSIDKKIMEEKCNNVIFDMAGLTFMDSTGIGVLLGRYKLIKRRGLSAMIANCNEQIDKVLSMSGIYTIMEKIS